jgi:uncharacterized membrane protein HdeD (DUF308 family)
MATVNANERLRGPAAIAKTITGWFIAMAVFFIVLGLAAIIEPGLAGLAVTLLVGWLLIVGAVAHFITALKGGGTRQVVWQVLTAIVYLFGGVYFLTHLIMGATTLTLLLAGIFLAEGVIEILAYFRTRLQGASRWLLLNGVVTIVLGALIGLQWPSSSVWAIGTLFGLNLLMTGISRLMFGLAARKLASRIAA